MSITKILQLSDTHIVDEGELAYNVVDTAKHLEMTVRQIIELLPKIGPIDAVIITGDLTDHGTAAAYHRFQELITPLEMPVFVIPGNHDRRDTLRTELSTHDYLPKSGFLNFYQKIGALNLLALDSLVEGKSHGGLADETLIWLDEHLTHFASQPVMVALHHPPFECGIRHMDQIKLQNADEFLSVLIKHQAANLTICGHVHRFITRRQGPSTLLIAPSVAHAVDLDHRPDGPSQFKMETGGFLLHRFDEVAAGFTSDYIPVGPFNGPFPFFDEKEE